MRTAKYKVIGFALTVVAVVGTLTVFLTRPFASAHSPDQESYTQAGLQRRLGEGKVVLVTIDADWALKPTDRPMFLTKSVSSLIRQDAYVTMVADWTKESKELETLVANLDREEIPALAVYDPKNPDSPSVFHRDHKESDIIAALQSTLQ